MTLVNSILNSAKSYVGTQEGSAAHQDIIDLYNRGRYSDAYCMTIMILGAVHLLLPCSLKTELLTLSRDMRTAMG